MPVKSSTSYVPRIYQPGGVISIALDLILYLDLTNICNNLLPILGWKESTQMLNN